MSVSAIRRLILTGLLILIGVALSIANPTFLKLDNLMTMLQEASLTGIVAIGFTLVSQKATMTAPGWSELGTG